MILAWKVAVSDRRLGNGKLNKHAVMAQSDRHLGKDVLSGEESPRIFITEAE